MEHQTHSQPDEFVGKVEQIKHAESQAQKIIEGAKQAAQEHVSQARQRAAKIISEAQSQAVDAKDAALEESRKRVDGQTSKLTQEAKAHADKFRSLKISGAKAAKLAQMVLGV